MRIVSLVPSITELLYDLDLHEEVVGITRFCIHPKSWHDTKPRVGGTKDVDVAKVRDLSPDFVFANKEENVKEQVEEMEQFTNVIVTDVNDVFSAVSMIRSLGRLCGRERSSQRLGRQIMAKFTYIESHFPLTAAYLIWKDPLMTVGADTYINHMMRAGNFKNVFSDKTRYPEISEQDLVDAKPEVLLLSSEPYPFAEKHLEYFRELLPQSQVTLVDGSYFSWYGSRMLNTPDYLDSLRQRIDSDL